MECEECEPEATAAAAVAAPKKSGHRRCPCGKRADGCKKPACVEWYNATKRKKIRRTPREDVKRDKQGRRVCLCITPKRIARCKLPACVTYREQLRAARAALPRNKQGKILCEHGRRKDTCRDCGGSGICEHGRRREICNACGGLPALPHLWYYYYHSKCGNKIAHAQASAGIQVQGVVE